MARKIQFGRLLLMAVLLGCAFAGLGYRLVDLQVLRHTELKAIAQQNTQREFLFEPRRGDILDCKGNLLATSVSAKVVCADPTLIGNRTVEVARTLVPLLAMSEAEVYQKLLPRTRVTDKGETITNSYVRLKNRVSVETWETIKSNMLSLTFGLDEKKLPKTDQLFYRNLRRKALFTEEYPIRVYPNQNLAAHVLGFATTGEKKIDEHLINEIQGRDGIELTLNSKLNGVAGWRRTETDRRGREVVSLREQDVEPREGLNVVLTIDSVIQNALESILGDTMEKHTPISVTGVVMRPRTGEILAMATLPTFDPNNPGAAPADARRNRVISDIAEPGSTFKIVVVSGGLNDGFIRLSDPIFCENGLFHYGGRSLHDHEKYATLSVKDIIMKSSNIGAAKIGIKMGEDRLYEYLAAFGLTDRTGIPLPGEVRGIVHPVTNWSKVSIAQIPMGQGVAVTRLQMLMAMSAIANHGTLMRPMLVDHLEDQDGNIVARYAPQPVRQVVSESASKLMIEALKTVVSSNGTAPKAALEHYTVAGKTGTAQKVEGGRYVHGKYISSFIGFFPADNPELCISIVLDEPKEGYYGGRVAAPAFRQIAERAASYLNIRPDIEDKNPAPDSAPAADVPRVAATH
ncbi:MAG TPA: penicillin-binding protein 2 [Candidatus Paceibacterota bacterium]|nr:penicillin-binding protein 2 [Candidatus Paceibacterota bacterium]